MYQLLTRWNLFSPRQRHFSNEQAPPLSHCPLFLSHRQWDEGAAPQGYDLTGRRRTYTAIFRLPDFSHLRESTSQNLRPGYPIHSLDRTDLSYTHERTGE